MYGSFPHTDTPKLTFESRDVDDEDLRYLISCYRWNNPIYQSEITVTCELSKLAYVVHLDIECVPFPPLFYVMAHQLVSKIQPQNVEVQQCILGWLFVYLLQLKHWHSCGSIIIEIPIFVKKNNNNNNNQFISIYLGEIFREEIYKLVINLCFLGFLKLKESL